MAMENWISGAERHAIALILDAMKRANISLDDAGVKRANISLDDAGMKTGGGVLRIPMGKLKKAGYKFLGSDIDEDGKNFQKLSIYPKDTDESISLLATATDKVISEIEGKPTIAEDELTRSKSPHKREA